MKHCVNSIRTFVGAKEYNVSRAFYTDLGFTEHVISPKMSYFSIDKFGFYLQDHYLKDWIENSMVFLEVDSVDRYWTALDELQLHTKYKGVKLTSITNDDWGRECFMYDPSGVLWHFGEFN